MQFFCFVGHQKEKGEKKTLMGQNNAARYRHGEAGNQDEKKGGYF